ncbi:MAG: twin-arginine translocase TatA/TatE family subunit [Candidatus Omnitrophica bacterium]|nr:twin-arginine translocase TatA/TatE family subunit [Candidatus Omnitrophota bacterium]
MGNLGLGEIVVLLVIVLLIFGAKKLPEIGRAMGRAIKEFKKGHSEEDNKNSDDKTD